MKLPDTSRRNFVKRGAYVAPVILTLAAAPAFAKAGSEKPGDDKNPNAPGNGWGPGGKPKP